MNFKFPQYLHLPIQVLDYEPDDIAIAMFLFVLCMVFGGIGWWVALLVVPWLYRTAKENYPRGFIKHIFYFFGLTELKGYPNFFQKEFTE